MHVVDTAAGTFVSILSRMVGSAECFQPKDTSNWLQNAARFAAERRKDQRHISGLVHDANAVEAALLRKPLGESRRRARPVDPTGDSGSCQRGEGSMGATIETNGSSKSNAYVEPEPREDPNFISLDQASKRRVVRPFQWIFTGYVSVDITFMCLRFELCTYLENCIRTQEKHDTQRQDSGENKGIPHT